MDEIELSWEVRTDRPLDQIVEDAVYFHATGDHLDKEYAGGSEGGCVGVGQGNGDGGPRCGLSEEECGSAGHGYWSDEDKFKAECVAGQLEMIVLVALEERGWRQA